MVAAAVVACCLLCLWGHGAANVVDYDLERTINETWAQVLINNGNCDKEVRTFDPHLHYKMGQSRAKKTVRAGRKWGYKQCTNRFLDPTVGPNAQNNEDLKLWKRFFSDEKYVGNGFFVEMGGSNGVTFSNSLFFEYCLGWNGMLLEASPENYDVMIHQRTCTTNILGASCPAGGRRSTFIDRDQGNSRVFDDVTPGKRFLETPCRPLSEVFAAHNVTWIDFFSLDVERAEALVLSTIDWTKVQVGVLLVEAVDLTRVPDVDFELIEVAGMVKVCTSGKKGCLPDCQLKLKPAMKQGSANAYMYMNDIYVHRTLRDDVCPPVASGTGRRYGTGLELGGAAR